jgi:hypothetical protein
MIGAGRGSRYRIAPTFSQVVASTAASRDANSIGIELNSKDSEPSSKDNGDNSKDSESGLSRSDEITEDIQQQLERIARPVVAKRRVRPTERDATIIQLCRLVPLSANQIAKLLGRDILYMRQQILPQLIEKGMLKYLFPETPNHPGQRYLAPNHGDDNDDE